MLRRSIYLLSFVAMAALIAWGFIPRTTTPACAAGSSAANCAIQFTVNPPSLTGTPASPSKVGVTWTVTNIPPCYTITGADVQFTITRKNAGNIVKKVSVTGTGNSVLADLNLGSNLPVGERPDAITAEVTLKAEADPNKRRTEANTKTL